MIFFVENGVLKVVFYAVLRVVVVSKKAAVASDISRHFISFLVYQLRWHASYLISYLNIVVSTIII